MSIDLLTAFTRQLIRSLPIAGPLKRSYVRTAGSNLRA